MTSLTDIVKVCAGGNNSWAIKDSDLFRARHADYIEDVKATALANKTSLDGILDTTQSPIAKKEEEKGKGELLFMEDVDKYDSFLRKSSYLDSP